MRNTEVTFESLTGFGIVRCISIVLLLTFSAGCLSRPVPDVAYRPSTADPIQFRGQSVSLNDPWRDSIDAAPGGSRNAQSGHSGFLAVGQRPATGGWSLPSSQGHTGKQESVVISASVDTFTEDDEVRAWTHPDLETRPLSSRSADTPDALLIEPSAGSSSQNNSSAGPLRLLRPSFGGLSQESTTVEDWSSAPQIIPSQGKTAVEDSGSGGSTLSAQPQEHAVTARTWSDLSSRSPSAGAVPAPYPVQMNTGPVNSTVQPVEVIAGHVDATAEIQAVSVPTISEAAVPVAVEQPATTENPELATGHSGPEREQSMLQRFRGLYSPGPDHSPGDAALRQLRRLQSPWNLFGDREEPAGPPLPTAMETVAVPPATATVVTPATTDTSALESLIQALESELQAWPRDASGRPVSLPDWRIRQTDLRMLYAIAQESGRAVSTIPELPASEQEFWQSIMLALSYYRSNETTDSTGQNRAAALEQLRIAVRRLQSELPLSISRMIFCSAIHGFGSVDAFPSATFRPGEPVLLYAELQNFRSRHTPIGTYRSEFSATLEIRRQGTSAPLETIRLPAIVDESITERTDFYQSYEMTIPGHLRPGRYTVRLTVRDKSDQETAIADAPFDVR